MLQIQFLALRVHTENEGEYEVCIWGKMKAENIIFTETLRIFFLCCEKPCLVYLCLFGSEYSDLNLRDNQQMSYELTELKCFY